MIDRAVVYVGFISGLVVALTFSIPLVRPVKENNILNLVADVKMLEEHPGSSIVKSYRLSDVTILNGTIVLGREQIWQFVYPQNGSVIYAPVYVSNRLYLNGLVTLNLTSKIYNGKIIVEVRRG
ncbi:MAG: hypothetical protein DRJ32_03160 [Thermoprotei archaeon]|nr:MAG: hypothetical protein DRJ32_03160 [Thermoprotei archaeon]